MEERATPCSQHRAAGLNLPCVFSRSRKKRLPRAPGSGSSKRESRAGSVGVATRTAGKMCSRTTRTWGSSGSRSGTPRLQPVLGQCLRRSCGNPGCAASGVRTGRSGPLGRVQACDGQPPETTRPTGPPNPPFPFPRSRPAVAVGPPCKSRTDTALACRWAGWVACQSAPGARFLRGQGL